MIPLRDVIPARTTPWVTFTLLGLNLVVALCLHGGWVQLIANLWALWIFGGNVEDRLGHGRFLLFFLLTGAGAGLVQVWPHPTTATALAGATSAIAGVMGAYLVLFPQSKILVLVFFPRYLDVVEIPAVVFLILWFMLQIVASMGRADGFGGMVVNWAPIAGFAAGLLGVFPLRRREREKPDWWTT